MGRPHVYLPKHTREELRAAARAGAVSFDEIPPRVDRPRKEFRGGKVYVRLDEALLDAYRSLFASVERLETAIESRHSADPAAYEILCQAMAEIRRLDSAEIGTGRAVLDLHDILAD